MWRISSGILLGFGLGSNDFSNIFGTSVSAGLIRYRTAVILCSTFLLLGAFLEGPKCLETVGKLAELSYSTAFACTLASAIVIGLLTYFALPASASQAIIGAIVGVGATAGATDYLKLLKIFTCWVLTPFGALLFSFLLYFLLSFAFDYILKSLYWRRTIILVGVLLAGCYGAYSFGANNVANVTGVYVGSGVLSPDTACIIGGLSMAAGVIGYGYRVMETVGKKIVPLDPFSALVAMLANAVVLHYFTQVGVPVSSSQAVVGAVVGVGLVKDYRTVSPRMIAMICAGWFFTPLSAGLLSFLLVRIL
ncbi:MAG: inorganic phosphate transporter [Desulfobulbaceae bacterium]|nr:inorganic phosphate transporter [Desulfobulbaceae bacterium]